MGLFADTSFNSEIVKIDQATLKALLLEMYDRETARQFTAEFRKVLKEGDYEALKKAVIETALTTLVGTVSAATIHSIKALIGIPV